MSGSGYEVVPLEDFQSVFGGTFTEISSEALNSHVVSVSDEFFAAASQLLEVGPALSLKGQFGPNGALYSGWETRRHNTAHDWCIIKLGVPSGYIIGFDIDTSNFNGNEAPAASVGGFFAGAGSTPPKWDDQWDELLPRVKLGPNSRHLFKIPKTKRAYTHVKLSMYPDGGIARFRVYGVVSPIFPGDRSATIDLAHVYSGGCVVSVSDQHFGIGPNLLLPGRGKDMSDGWETKRSRLPDHNDSAIIRLGASGFLEQVEIDTANFVGNFPESCEVHALNSPDVSIFPPDLPIPSHADPAWSLILPRTNLGPNRRHFFQLDGQLDCPYTHVKVTIYPDGGIKRVRVIGRRSFDDLASENILGSVEGEEIKALPKLPVLSEDTVDSSRFTRPSIFPAVPLTREAFARFGDVIQAWANPNSAPKGIRVTSANQGTAFKFHKLSAALSSYPSDANAGPPGISVFRCTPPHNLPEGARSFPVRILERHPLTNQAFIPMGYGTIAGAEDDVLPEAGKAYLVIVALNGSDDKPDLKTLRAFIASTSQGVSYGVGIWHHPMIALEKPIDFACVETQIGTPGSKLDCEVVDVQDGPLIHIPNF
ncbi:Allantoicase [Cantharellus anzutake]|uniref:Allantoicase n=1 Tax=Cantharellus anzutake TaxID=1750568 RepID=UPI001908F5A4|nr:Allantoicase [Cantharellus anzutake]KAF8342006.1 Allantoicase [Cantharellus anzutake]